MSAQTVDDSLDKYVDDDLFSTLLKYGLFVSAIFQLLLIATSILVPAADADDEGNEETKHSVDTLANVRRLHKLRKLEKKKRR